MQVGAARRRAAALRHGRWGRRDRGAHRARQREDRRNARAGQVEGHFALLHIVQ